MLLPRALLTSCVASLILLGATSLASATKPSVNQPPSISLRAAPTTVGLAAAPARLNAKPDTCAEGTCIVCTPSGDNAHKSTHEPTTINVIVSATCTEPVPLLTIHAGIYHWTGSAWELSCCSVKSVIGKAEISENYAVPCVPGWYQGYEELYVQFVNESTGSSKGAVGKEAYIAEC
jgi:hypothetical protein